MHAATLLESFVSPPVSYRPAPCLVFNGDHSEPLSGLPASSSNQLSGAVRPACHSASAIIADDA